MSKSITVDALLEWFKNNHDYWHEDDYRLVLSEAEDNTHLKKALETAYLLDELEMDYRSQMAAILFVLRIENERIPEKLRKFVEHLYTINQLSQLSAHQERSQETLRKMLITMAADIRVVVVMLSYQVVIMRDARHWSEEHQRQVGRKTIDIYAPLANRLGLARLKWELEDFSLRFLEPDTYRTIAKKLDGRRTDREIYINKIIEALTQLLNDHDIKGEVSGRVKHIYSIWKKLNQKEKNRSFEDLFDIRAVRIMVDDLTDCYTVLGLVHDIWTPIPKEFDDYIANPKPNGYQSLHTAVLGPENKTVEVQIRTYKMHENAELGVAAHWRYKEGSSKGINQEHLNWFRELLQRDYEDGDDEEYIEESVFNEYVYVMTPAGEAIELASGSTPLDFAYKIHTDLGHRCRGAKVNGKIVPLTYQLNNADVVEILAGKKLEPSRDWMSPYLGYTKSNRTRAKIRTWFSAQANEQNSEAGRHLLEREFSRLNIKRTPDQLTTIAHKLGYPNLEELYRHLGSGDISLSQLLARIPSINQKEKESGFDVDLMVRPKSKEVSTQSGVHVRGVGNLLINIAPCCRPAPPDLIGGYITVNRGVSIHRLNCQNYQNMLAQNQERRVDVDWGLEEDQTVLVDLHVEALQSTDLLKEISILAANEQLRIINMELHSEEDNRVSIDLTLEIHHLDQLSRLLDRLNQMSSIIRAFRR